jgi:hypothetical protein
MDPKRVDVEQLISFSVDPLSKNEQEKIEKENQYVYMYTYRLFGNRSILI